MLILGDRKDLGMFKVFCGNCSGASALLPNCVRLSLDDLESIEAQSFSYVSVHTRDGSDPARVVVQAIPEQTIPRGELQVHPWVLDYLRLSEGSVLRVQAVGSYTGNPQIPLVSRAEVRHLGEYPVSPASHSFPVDNDQGSLLSGLPPLLSLGLSQNEPNSSSFVNDLKASATNKLPELVLRKAIASEVAIAAGTLFAITLLGKVHIFKAVSLSLQLPARMHTRQVSQVDVSTLWQDSDSAEGKIVLREKLFAFYSKYNPEKLGTNKSASNEFITNILAKYSDREDELWSNLQRKYSLTNDDLQFLNPPQSVSPPEIVPAQTVAAVVPHDPEKHIFGRFACHHHCVHDSAERMPPNSRVPVTQYARCKLELSNHQTEVFDDVMKINAVGGTKQRPWTNSNTGDGEGRGISDDQQFAGKSCSKRHALISLSSAEKLRELLLLLTRPDRQAGYSGKYDCKKEATEVLAAAAVVAPGGVIVHGPVGAGHEAMAEAVCQELQQDYDIHVLSLRSTILALQEERAATNNVIFTGRRGPTASAAVLSLRAAVTAVLQQAPSILVLRNFDVLLMQQQCGDRCNSDRDNYKGILQELAAYMTGIHNERKRAACKVTMRDETDVNCRATNAAVAIVAIMDTPNLTLLPTFLQREGTFQRKISVPVPTEAERRQILSSFLVPILAQSTADWGLINKLSVRWVIFLAQRTPGFGYDDLRTLCMEAIVQATERTYKLALVSNKLTRYWLRTRRLGFGIWTYTDVDKKLATGLWGDERVTRLIGGPWTPAQVDERLLCEVQSQQRHKMQYYPLYLLGSGDSTDADVHIGCCGLRPYKLQHKKDRNQENKREQDVCVVEMGVHIRHKHWRQGFATEAATAAVKHAFTNRGCDAVFAGHHPSNIGSRCMLTKLGFRYTHDEFYEPTGRAHPSYLITKREFLQTARGSADQNQPQSVTGIVRLEDFLVVLQKQRVRASQLEDLDVHTPALASETRSGHVQTAEPSEQVFHSLMTDTSVGPKDICAALRGVAGYEAIKYRLVQLIQWRWTAEGAAAFKRLGTSPSKGILLHGPSGCGKTLMVRALAAACAANYVQIKMSDLLCKYLGETERALRAVFSRARAAAPCILFFDELDSIAAKRSFSPNAAGENGDSGTANTSTGVYARVLSTLLNEMDGIGETVGGEGSVAEHRSPSVIVLAATNKVNVLDPALTRPGRIDQKLYVGLPNASDRFSILMLHSLKTPIGDNTVHLTETSSDCTRVDATPPTERAQIMQELSRDEYTGGLSGADLHHVCREAGIHALNENMTARWVSKHHYMMALDIVTGQQHGSKCKSQPMGGSQAVSSTSEKGLPSSSSQRSDGQFRFRSCEPSKLDFNFA